ncbi:peptidase G1 [Boletus reticuloceps]|uniref:Peptidase G1 n=1 Tax=Boletus reticuloceps TaxID=495285 RepID=A0A8I2YWD3_9AGAM|nr:peptidase G1 [Boletus reticuloceps]
MRFNPVLISIPLFASAVLAGQIYPQTQFHNGVEKCTNTTSDSSWGGAVGHGDNGTFHYVTGSFKVPDIAGQKIGSTAVALIGIDGTGSCSDRKLQVGVIFTTTENGPVYRPAYWFGAGGVPRQFTRPLEVSAGDAIELWIGAPLHGLTGMVLYENRSKNQSAFKTVNITHQALCRQTTEWIVEYLEGYPLANFSMVTFTDAMAFAKGNRTFMPQEATIVDIQENGRVLTSVSVDGSSVTVNHV